MRRALPVETYRDARQWCTPTKAKPYCMPPTSFDRVSRIATRVIFNHKLTNNFSQKPPAPKPFLSPDLSKSETRLEAISNAVSFSQTCIEAMDPHDINKPPPKSHPATKLLAHMREHGVPISAKQGMTEQELVRSMRYGAHTSATKETAFVRTDLAKQARAGHIDLSPSGKSAISPDYGYPPSHPSRSEAENPALFTTSPGVA